MINFSEFNNAQKKAVQSEANRLLVLAGAGSGKTKVLTSRIVHLIDNGIDPSNILSVTFTNKASNEMKERILRMIDFDLVSEVDKMWMGTFHSICNKILRYNLEKSNYEIIDSDDQKKLIKNIFKDAGYKDMKADMVNLLTNFISKAKNNFLYPEESHILNEKYPELTYPNKLYELYEKHKKSMNIFDFDDLIFKTVELFNLKPNIKKLYQNKFEHILVDEYQDTNTIQDLLLDCFLRENGTNSLFVVGDEDQSIYGWRGAEVDNILNFNKKFINSDIIKLEQNYRSKGNILKVANKIISTNKKRIGKNLFTKAEDGPKITVYKADTPEEEAKFIVSCIKKTISNNEENPVALKDIAIAYRSNFISRLIESSLTNANIPYKVIGGVGFWSRLEIKDFLAYLSILNNSNNNIQAERILSNLKGIGKKTIDTIKLESNASKMSYVDIINKKLENNEFKGKNKDQFQQLIDLINNSSVNLGKPYNLLKYIYDNTDLISTYHLKEGEEKGLEREQNVEELLSHAYSFINEDNNMSDIDSFLSQISLQQDMTEKKGNTDVINLMTLHAAKGLEFPYFFVAGVESDIFPSARSHDNNDTLEEERRLMYVAITRAMHKLCLSYAPYRFGGKPTGRSNFIDDMPKELLESNDPDLFDYSSLPYKEGDEYEHDIYGIGVIIGIHKRLNKLTLTIDFPENGRRNIIL